MPYHREDVFLIVDNNWKVLPGIRKVRPRFPIPALLAITYSEQPRRKMIGYDSIQIRIQPCTKPLSMVFRADWSVLPAVLHATPLPLLVPHHLVRVVACHLHW